jgi:formylglycine-generating enzyme required for sulfatase activity
MFRKTSPVALAAILAAALAGLTLATAPVSPPAAGAPNGLSKAFTADLGGGVKLDLVLIPAGEFMMGSPATDKNAAADEKPQHRVRITKPFYMGKYPVTQEQWTAVMGSNPSQFKGPQNPVEEVSWDDGLMFFKRLNEKVGGGKFQFPTEAQWEYACRAGTTTRFCFGDDEAGLADYGWFNTNSAGKTHPVGEKKPNAWGLYDMHGNVWQWCADWNDATYYAHSPTDDPTGPASGTLRISHGGCWFSGASAARSANHGRIEPEHRGSHIGIRAAFVLWDK